MPNPRGPLKPRPELPWIVATLAASIAFPNGAMAGKPVEIVARLVVTTDPEQSAVPPPGPFAVLPGGRRIVIQVPASEGLLVLEGSRLVRHLPLPRGSIVHDLDASAEVIVAGASIEGGRVTTTLQVFDVGCGALLTSVHSANPFLRMHSDSSRGWRVVAGSSGVGIFHPRTAATYPLWAKGTGLVPSSEQIGRALAGLGLERGPRWVPQPDGSVAVRCRGRSVPVVPAGNGRFVAGLGDDIVLMRGEKEDIEKPTIALQAFRNGRLIDNIYLPVRDPGLPPARAAFNGRIVRVREGRIYWAHFRGDALEIRSMVPELPSHETGLLPSGGP